MFVLKQYRHLILIAFPLVLFSQTMSQIPFDVFRTITADPQKSRSVTKNYEIARELVKPLALSATDSEQISSFLTNAQVNWQDGKAPSLSVGKLTNSVNRHLGLEDSAEYLKLSRDDLRRIRVQIWIEAPGLTSGIVRDPKTGESTVASDLLSPFEAYSAAGMLIYQKLHSDKYVRTAEERASIKAEPKRAPGIYVRPYNPRNEEFRLKMITAARKFSSGAAIVNTLTEILNESKANEI